ncbi:hypothetical protein AB0N16_34475 [Streptomyces sp. NPDC051105]|uniref:hypothetical protein n=1 Tax=Streptomyces sp. NPDC051105 TaxID=3154843 RepID=UPI0034160075
MTPGHPASTRYQAAISQRTLTAAYRKADYFARNVRTIQVLIDRDSTLWPSLATPGGAWAPRQASSPSRSK